MAAACFVQLIQSHAETGRTVRELQIQHAHWASKINDLFVKQATGQVLTVIGLIDISVVVDMLSKKIRLRLFCIPWFHLLDEQFDSFIVSECVPLCSNNFRFVLF